MSSVDTVFPTYLFGIKIYARWKVRYFKLHLKSVISVTSFYRFASSLVLTGMLAIWPGYDEIKNIMDIVIQSVSVWDNTHKSNGIQWRANTQSWPGKKWYWEIGFVEDSGFRSPKFDGVIFKHDDNFNSEHHFDNRIFRIRKNIANLTKIQLKAIFDPFPDNDRKKLHTGCPKNIHFNWVFQFANAYACLCGLHYTFSVRGTYTNSKDSERNDSTIIWWVSWENSQDFFKYNFR